MSTGIGPGPLLFRVVLRAFPSWFLEEHEAGMVELFQTRLRRASTVRQRLRVWARSVVDVLRSAWSVRRWRSGGLPDPTGRERADDFARGRRGSRVETLLQDVRQTIRTLLRAPGFTVGAVALLAVGIGANSTVFSLVDSLLFRPLPWGNPEEVVYVYQDSDDGEPSSSSFPAYRDMTESDVFAHVGATSPSSATLEGSDGPVDVSTEFTTASFMDVLGLSPARGRWFSPQHDQVGSELTAVVSYPTWVSRFGSDPGMVGSTVRLNGQPVTVIGVGPQNLTGSFPPFVTDFWLSISTTPIEGDFRVANLDRRSDHWYDIRARLASGATVVQAQAAMDALATRLAESFPEFNRGRGITVFRSRDVRANPTVDGDLFQAGSLLMAVVATILLLACANLANLLLVRGLGRSGEMAVRRAMGARGRRVARLFFLESLLLALGGGGLGILFTAWAVRILPTLPLGDVFPGALELRLDWRVVLYSLVLVVVTGLLFGLVPAIRASRDDVASTLRDERRGVSVGRGTARIRNALVSVQVGASLLLVFGTGMLVRSLLAVQQADPGVDADRVAWLRTDLNPVTGSPEEVRVLLQELQERLASLPGVSAVGASHRIPAQGGGTTTTIVEDYTPPAGTEAVELPFVVVSDGYFETLGIDVLEGRTFGPDDLAGGSTVVVVNETAAQQFWGSVDVVGRRMRGQNSENWRTVIGVVSDAPVSRLAEDIRPAFYYSERQTGGIGSPFLVVRSDGDPRGLLASMRDEVRATRAGLAIDAQGTLAEYFGETLAAPRFAATILGGFSLLAALLAGLGIYAVVSFGVARRTAELGIRMALGAASGRVVKMVVRDVLGTVVVGLVAGLALAALIGPRLAGVMYGVDGGDPVTFAGSLVLILAVAGLAAWIPAQRAARADPVEALRV